MEINKVIFDTNVQCCDISNEIIKKETMKNGIVYDEIDFNRCPCADKVQLILGDDYEIKVEDGKTYVVKKKTKYLKTYEECCDVLGIAEDLWFVYEDIDGNHINPACISNYRMRRLDLYHNLEKLIICRDAYWKLAGDWKPDVMYGDLYCIGYDGNVVTWKMQGGCRLLAFPTEEMRDAFYENFEDLIEECKELL